MGIEIKGRCWVFGNNIDTDQMAPGSTMTLEWDERRKTLFPKKPEFIAEMNEGDILVGGENWGCGSSREQAVEHLQLLGVGAIIAETYARIFFRNAVARALPVLICPDITKGINEGDTVSVDWDSFRIDNLTQGTSFQATLYNQDMKNIIESGGLVNILKKQLDPDLIDTINV